MEILAGDSPALRNSSTIIVLFGIFLLCFIWIGLYYKVQSERQMAIERAIKETSNFARAFEEHSSRTIKSADQTALFLKYQYEKEGRSIDIPQYIQEGRLTSQPFVLLGVIDENGHFVVSSQVPFIPSNLKDREHFIVHKDVDSKQLFISKPVLGRSSGKWSIQMTRRINKPDGSFGGVVVVSVDPFYFTEFYKQVDLGKHSSITLVGRDGIIRARQSNEDSEVGQSLNDSILMENLVGSNAGFYITKSAVDDINRIYSYRALNDYPFVVVVGVEEDEVLLGLKHRSIAYYMMASLATVVILLFVIMLLSVTARQKNRARFLASLNEVSLRMMDRVNLGEVLHEILQCASEISGAKDGMIALVNTVTGQGRVNATMGLHQMMMGRTISDDCCVISQILHKETSHVSGDSQKALACFLTPPNTAIVEFIAVPLRSADVLMGVLVLSYQKRSNSLTQRISEIKQFSLQASVALENAQLYSALEAELNERKAIQRELVVAKEASEAANRTKSGFLANMSHEIRTPMNPLLGMTELLLETPLTQEQLDMLRVVRSSGKSLLAIINDVLDFSKIEAEKLVLENIDFNLRILTEEVTDLVAWGARDKELEIKIIFDPLIPQTLRGDPGRLRQVLLNLAGNAVKFTDEGRVIIGVQRVEEHGERILIRFEVKDTGIGLSAETKGRLFHPFTQADGSTTRKYGGTGLGLSISKRLVELMGGDIGVESWEGEGSLFYFFIPLDLSSHQDTQVSNEMEEAAISPALSEEKLLFSRRVMLVEDNLANQKLGMLLLRKLGYQVGLAIDGRQAVEVAKTENYDIILMDCQMPGMDGFEATAIIREMEKRNGKHIPIIAMTANALQEDLEKCIAVGMDDYMSKPINPRLLRKVLERWLSK